MPTAFANKVFNLNFHTYKHNLSLTKSQEKNFKKGGYAIPLSPKDDSPLA
jgi:hypothetical protein